MGPIGRGASRTAAKRHRRGAVERPGERMLARVARWGRETPTPNARGLLGKARPPRVSRGLRGGRRAYPKGRQADIPAPRGRVTSDAVTRARAGAGFWTSRSPNARREGPNDLAPAGPRGEPNEGTPSPSAPRKAAGQRPRARTADRRRWAGRACRGGRANHGQGTRQNRPVTSGEGALAGDREPQWRGPGDCLPKTQDSAQAARRRIGSDACPVPEGHGEVSPQGKHRTQAPVNGGRNYNGPKVAKFLVG